MEIKETKMVKDMLTAGEGVLKERRATLLAEEIANSFDNKYREIETKLRKLEIEADRSDDFGPDDSTSLVITNGLSAEDYVKKILEAKKKKYMLFLSLRDVSTAYEDRFGKEFLKSRNIMTSEEIRIKYGM